MNFFATSPLFWNGPCMAVLQTSWSVATTEKGEGRKPERRNFGGSFLWCLSRDFRFFNAVGQLWTRRIGWSGSQGSLRSPWKSLVSLASLKSSKDFGIDLNAKNNIGSTAWHLACRNGQTETAQLLIQSSKEFGIDLNAKDNNGSTALHLACINGKTETVQMILKNWKEFGIDIKAQNNQGQTALDLINHHQGGIWNQIKKMLEKEFSQIDVTEPVFCDQQWNFRVFCSPFLDFF